MSTVNPTNKEEEDDYYYGEDEDETVTYFKFNY